MSLRKYARIAISRIRHFPSPKQKKENTLQYKVPPKTWENSPQKTTFDHLKVVFRPLLHTKRRFSQNLPMAQLWRRTKIGDRGGHGLIRTTFGSSCTFSFCWGCFKRVVAKIVLLLLVTRSPDETAMETQRRLLWSRGGVRGLGAVGKLLK